MSFEHIPANQANKDVLRADTLTPIPYPVFKAERSAWNELAEGGSCDADMISFFKARVKDALSKQMLASAHMQTDGNTEMVLKLSRRASAELAMARLMRLVLPEWKRGEQEQVRLATAIDAYPETVRRKRLIDMHEGALIDDAHGLTIHPDLLAISPFEHVDLPPQGKQWFMHPTEGIYVATKTPAQTTHILREELALSVGSMQAAEALIDAPNAVTLLPYFSQRYLTGRSA
jgi:hypothetical protein